MASAPVAILAGGLGTRLGPVSDTTPKAMVEVAGRPFIEHQLALLARHGLQRAVLCVGYRGELIEAHLGSRACGIDLTYSYDGPRLLGTGGALRRAAPHLGDACWVLYGDAYLDIDYGVVWQTFVASGAGALMVVLRNEGRWDSSNVVFRDGVLVRYDKRRPDGEMAYIDYGIALLRREIVQRIPENEPSDLAVLYSALVSEGIMVGYEVTSRFYEIGSPRGLADTRAYLQEHPQGRRR